MDKVVEALGPGHGLRTEDEIALARAVVDPRERDFGAGNPPPLETACLHACCVGNITGSREGNAVEHLLQADDRLPALRLDQRRSNLRNIEAAGRLPHEAAGLDPHRECVARGDEVAIGQVHRVDEALERGPRAGGVERGQRRGADWLVSHGGGWYQHSQHGNQREGAAGSGGQARKERMGPWPQKFADDYGGCQ